MSDSPQVIVLPPLGRGLTHVWHLLFDLADELPDVWCLIGGLMVALHGLEHGRTDARPSADGDVLVDVRADLTTSPPGRTIQVPSGTQALHRSEYVQVQVEGRIGRIPRPSLLAAIIA